MQIVGCEVAGQEGRTWPIGRAQGLVELVYGHWLDRSMDSIRWRQHSRFQSVGFAGRRE